MNRQINENVEKIKLVFIYITFGTIGLVTHFIPLSSPAIVFYRAIFGALFIIISTYAVGDSINLKSILDNFVVLIFTGLFMGLNWVLQFEAFRVSSVAIGTVCYNTMPIFLIIIASIVFQEKMSYKTIICIIIATIGVVLVSNVMNTGIKSSAVIGSVYGILGAIFYALILTFNRYLSDISTRDKVVFQFVFSAIIMAIYIIFISKSSFIFDSTVKTSEMFTGIICILLLGIFHTGFCYIHYFNAVAVLKAETVGLLTYIDPVVALFLSYFVLKENMSFLQIIGAIMILGSTLVNELIILKNDK